MPIESASLLDLPQELHDMIFGYLELRDLARLALTSKACYKSANPFIWRRVTGIDNLLKLMPADAWNGRHYVGIVTYILMNVECRHEGQGLREIR